MGKLKCYLGSANNNDEYCFHSVCFAENSRQAKKLMWKYSELSEACDGEYTEERVNRYKDYDHHLESEKTEAYVVTNTEILRQMNWRVDGDSSCSTCGLYEMDGEFPVCEECEQCPDCGCSCE